MSPRHHAILLAVLSVAMLHQVAAGQEQGSAQTAEGGASQAEATGDLQQLIRDLDANRFSKRQDASRQLKSRGAEAIAALIEASLGESREASSRAFEILKDHYQNGNDDLKAAAKEALQKIADGDKASLARQAKELLDPKPQQAAPQLVPFGGQIQLQMRAAAPQRIQVQNANGIKDINVQENGRNIKIHDDPNKGIKVEITEKKDGKEVNSKFEAKNADELKKKHPEAYKIYSKYAQQGAGIQIQAMQMPAIQIQGFGGGFPVPAAPKPIEAQPIDEQLQKISAQVKEAQEQLERLKENPNQTEAIQKAIEQLKETQKAIEETRAKTK